MSVIKYPLNVLYIANVFDLSLVEYGFTYNYHNIILHVATHLSTLIAYIIIVMEI